MRLAQPIETKQKVWLRGVDLNHRPLGYEGNHQQNLKTMRGANSNALFLRRVNVIFPAPVLPSSQGETRLVPPINLPPARSAAFSGLRYAVF
jgi:hypothetical protein